MASTALSLISTLLFKTRTLPLQQSRGGLLNAWKIWAQLNLFLVQEEFFKFWCLCYGAQACIVLGLLCPDPTSCCSIKVTGAQCMCQTPPLVHVGWAALSSRSDIWVLT